MSLAPAPSRARLGRALLVFASVGHILGYLYAAPEHVVDPSWPPHARFHVLQAIFWIAGLDLAAVAIVLGPLAREQRWARATLLMIWPFAHVAYFVALLRGGGPPETSAHLALGVLLVMYGAGLALVWRSPPDASATTPR
ncbi:MAG: hypothetical protein KDK70_08155 [Myxococcales bacterium]|nr:hypothetical protein [Myxococcales bacterium]